MDGALFEEWVRELDRKFVSEGRSKALVIDDCPAHPHIENLKSIKLFFSPPNTTSATQPMDQGGIRSLKTKYRNNMVRKIIRNLEKNKLGRQFRSQMECKCWFLHGIQYPLKLL